MPGLIAIDRALETVADPDQRVASGQTLNRPIEPTTIANAVSFLCSEESEMMTSQMVNVTRLGVKPRGTRPAPPVDSALSELVSREMTSRRFGIVFGSPTRLVSVRSF